MPIDIEWLVSCYGFLVPFGETYTGKQLAKAIADTYCKHGVICHAIKTAEDLIVSIHRGCGDVFSGKYIVKGEV